MLVRLRCLPALFVATAALSQTPQPAATPQTTPAPQIHTGAQLVIVDVVVQDSAGHPVRNLPRDAFHVTESKVPQAVTAFEEHSTANPPKPGPPIPKMPPGIFSDYTPVPPGGALNVLLIDALNTPMQDQAFLRDQLKQYVNKAQPGAQVAIFGLNTRLYLLQGFTSNLDTLKDAVNHKLIPRASNILDNPVTGADDPSLSELTDMADEIGASEAAANLQQFEAVEQSYKLQLRIQYTLDAFNGLAHYLASFPGRKNLLWFSGSFPINILPDASIANPFAVMQVNEDEFRDTTSLLSRAQIAVYPIDARGLMTSPMMSAATSPTTATRNPAQVSAALNKFSNSQADEHMTMEQMASETGGHAFYNTNGLADAVTAALDTGANYYTLAYAPTAHDPHGEYRPIRVELTGATAGAGYKLSYRHGYYADNPSHAAHTTEAAAGAKPKPAAPSAPGSPAPSPAQTAADAYRRAALFHGAPAPEDILFKVRVLPVSATTDTELTKEDHPNPASPFKGPYRRYALDFAALGRDFHLALDPSGTYKGQVEFSAYVYDNDGKLLNVENKRADLNLSPESYKRIESTGLGMHLQVSAPAHGEYYLRLAVHDVTSNRFGVVEVPVASVSRLPPLPPDTTPAAPANTPNSTPAAATPPQPTGNPK